MSGFPVLHQFPELAQTHVPRVGDAIQPSHPLLPPSPTFDLSQHQGLFQWVDSLHQMAKVLELQYQSFQWLSELISFRIDWIDLFAVQVTFKSLIQHHSLKASILWCSAFFMVWLSHPYMATGKTIALTVYHYLSLFSYPSPTNLQFPQSFYFEIHDQSAMESPLSLHPLWKHPPYILALTKIWFSEKSTSWLPLKL